MGGFQFQKYWVNFFMLVMVVGEEEYAGNGNSGFVERKDSHFILNGRSHYVNGFNSYWLMNVVAAESDPSRSKVTTTFQEASKHGLNLARTWAFNDGGYKPLQISPASYDENVFRGLDFVISEAGKYGVQLILSLVNNWNDYGGKRQYVKWAKERGQYLTNDDDFFIHPVVKQYYKNHVKVIICTDEAAQDAFVDKWVEAHIEDSNDVLRKPILITEFGKSSKFSGYSEEKRNGYFEKMYNFVYNSSSNGGSCGGGLFWQFMMKGLDNLHDGYQVVFEESPSTVRVIDRQSKRMSTLKS